MDKVTMKIELTKDYIRENLEVKTKYIGNDSYWDGYKYLKEYTLNSPIGKIKYIPRMCDKDYDFEYMVESVIRSEAECEPMIYDSSSK